MLCGATRRAATRRDDGQKYRTGENSVAFVFTLESRANKKSARLHEIMIFHST